MVGVGQVVTYECQPGLRFAHDQDDDRCGIAVFFDQLNEKKPSFFLDMLDLRLSSDVRRMGSSEKFLRGPTAFYVCVADNYG